MTRVELQAKQDVDQLFEAQVGVLRAELLVKLALWQRDDLIRQAVKVFPCTKVAEAAGLTRGRVYQIVARGCPSVPVVERGEGTG